MNMQEEQNLLSQSSFNIQRIENKNSKLKIIFFGVLLVGIALVFHQAPQGLNLLQQIAPNDEKVNNPYNVFEFAQTSHGYQSWILNRDARIKDLEQGNVETTTNKFVDQTLLLAQLLNYETARIQFSDPLYDFIFEIPPSMSSLYGDYNKDFERGLLFQQMGFDVAPQGKFNLRLYDKHSKLDYLTTEGQPFLVMNHLMQIGFKLETTRVFGFGERTRNFRLTPGTYTVYSRKNDATVDDGQGTQGKEQMGSHPFVVAQLRNATFFGIFYYNSNPAQLQLQEFSEQVVIGDVTETRYYTSLTYTSTGGLLDIFFFTGPTYQEVLRQYHKLIGFPTMFPHYAHGMFAKSELYNDDQKLRDQLDKFASNNISIEGISLPQSAIKNQYQFQYNINIYDLKTDYPSIKWIMPWSPFFPKTTGSSLDNLVKKNLLVTFGGYGVQVTDEVKGDGYCIDYFNPNITGQLDQWLTNLQYEKTLYGVYLENNVPTFTKTNVTFSTDPNVNPYATIPVWPGSTQIYTNSLPTFAKHTINYDRVNDKLEQVHHLDVHNLFGKMMAQSFRQELSQYYFVFSDNTFPGAGAQGIAHIFSKNNNDWNGLKYTIAQILNFNMYGQPYSGHNICGYYQSTMPQYDKEELCLKSFQISFITPIAYFYTNDANFFSYSSDTLQKISRVVSQRLTFIMYQRAELYKISHFGGALVRPLIGEYPEISLYTPDMVDTVMYGDSLKVDFMLEPKQLTKTIIQPGRWLDLTSNQVRISKPNNTLVYTLDTHHANIVFQKQGTIVPMQNVRKLSQKTIDALASLPMDISIFLDANFIAKGHILVDERGDSEFYEVRAEKNIISFKQQNEGSVDPNNSNKKIRVIMMTLPAMELGYYHACAVMQDHITVQQLYVDEDQINQQIFIYPNDPNNDLDQSTISIDKIAFIFYGISYDENFKCDNSFIGGVITNTIADFPTVKQYTLKQKVNNLARELTDIIFKVSIDEENALTVSFAPLTKPIDEAKNEAHLEYKYRQVQESLELDDILFVNSDPFYFEIHDYQNPNVVFFSTKGMGFIFSHDFGMYSFVQPQSNPDRFFGIGERKGEFFLQDNFVYSLYTNNNNLNDIKQSNGRTIQFGKNGFFPLIYSQFKTSYNMLSVFLSEGSKDIFFNKQSGKPNQGPKISVIQTLNHVSMKLQYDKDPVSIIRSTHKNQYQPQNILIPPDWAYGHYHLVRHFQDDSDLFTVTDMYEQLEWPLEGFIFDLNYTGYSSLDFSRERFAGQHVNFTLARLYQKNMTIFNIMKSGIPINTDYFNLLRSKNALITREPYHLMQAPMVLGQDHQGTVGYPNYYVNSFSLSQYQEKAFLDFEGKYNITRYGIQLVHNEIFDVYCTNDCFRENQYDPMPQQLYKVGTNAQLRHSLSANAERNVDTHNGYAYKQHQRLWYNQYTEKKFFISQGMTAGSAKFGNIGRLIDYITPSDEIGTAAEAIQSLSILGIANVGERVDLVQGKVSNKTLAQHMMLQIFSPIAAHQYFHLTDMDPDLKYAAPFIRYKYMMIKYIQTQVFKQTYYGDPFVRPLFVEFPWDQQTYEQTKIQYMFGPSFMAIIQGNAVGQNKAWFPQGLWCSNVYYLDNPTCFISTGSFPYIQQNHIFMKAGTITPLQDPYGTFDNSPPVNTTFDLKNKDLDLHVVVNNVTQNRFAMGEILLYSDKSDETDTCYVSMLLMNNILKFEQTIGDVSNCRYEGFRLGKIFFYSRGTFPFTKAKINNQGGFIPILPPSDEPYVRDYIYLDLSYYNPRINVYNLQTINFF